MTPAKHARQPDNTNRSLPDTDPSPRTGGRWGWGWAVLAVAVLWMGAPGYVAAQDSATSEEAVEAVEAVEAAAPDSARMVEIEMRDGNVFVGVVISEDTEQVVIRTDRYGDLALKRSDIRSIRALSPSQIRNGEVWIRSAHDTRYFFQSNAFNLRKGEGYYQNAWVLFNQVSYGFTPHVSMGAGFIPMFLFAGEATPVWITPKVSIPIRHELITLGAGGIIGTLLGEGENAGIVFGNMTVGDRDRNLTFAGGYGYASDVDGDVLFGLSGAIRVRPTLSLMTENYFFAKSFLSFIGFRHTRRHLAIDGALVIPEGAEVAVPWLSVTVPFLSNGAEE